MAKKASAATIDQRIELIYRLILDGWESTAIVQNKTVQTWGVNNRQVRRYIERARKRMSKELEEYRKVAVEEHIAARRKLRREASDGRLALEVLRDEAKLLGLYAPERKEISGRDGGPIETKTDVTSSELDRGIAEALALLGKVRERSAADDSATNNQ